MKYAIIILIIGALLAAQSESKFKPSKLLRKISIKSYHHLAQKGAKSLLAASLFSGIGTPDHGMAIIDLSDTLIKNLKLFPQRLKCFKLK